MKLVSIIVPVYNCVFSIEHCINSLLNQSYENIEIIVVDDESTDGTRDKCQEIALLDSRVKFHNVKHCGVSEVRNVGLSKAKGEYIMFADADDYVKSSFVFHMVAAIEVDPKCDMAICSYERVVYGDLYPIRSLTENGIISKEDYLVETLKDPGHHYFGVLWNKIFKRDIIENYNLEFKKDITLGEDFVFSLHYLQKAKKVNVINDRLYYYCYQQNDTLSRKINKQVQDCEDEMNNRDKIFANYIDTMKSAGLYDSMRKRIYHYWIVFLIRQRYSLRTEYKWSAEEKRLWKKMMLDNQNIKKAISVFSKKQVLLEYVTYAGVQTAKNVMKKGIKTLRY